MISSSACLSLALAAAGSGEPAASGPTADQVRQAVEKSLPFLAKEGSVWLKKQGCAACHHLPMMVWSLNEAKNQGYAIDQPVLDEVTRWTLDPETWDSAFQDLPLDKNESETDYLGPLTMALGKQFANLKAAHSLVTACDAPIHLDPRAARLL